MHIPRVIAALLLVVAAAGSTALAEIGTIDQVPAATLLLPYFEVDIEDPHVVTVVRIGNAGDAPTVVHATLWTDAGVPTFAFDIYLGGYDVQEIVLETLFQGVLPHTGPTVSNVGPISLPHADLGCGGRLPAARLDVDAVTDLQRAHTGQPVASWMGQCGAHDIGDNRARGYITFDVVTGCSSPTTFPTDPTYFSTLASMRNTIWGELEITDSWQNAAYSDTLVHIEADPTHPLTDGAGDYTFYGRAVLGTGADHREGLASLWSVMYINTPTFDPGSQIVVWRDPPSPAAPFTCGSLPAAISSGQTVVFDEEENVLSPPLGCGYFARAPFSRATQSLQIDTADLPIPFPSGWLFMDLNLTSAAGLFGGRNQAWVGSSLLTAGRFAGSLPAWPLNNVGSDTSGGGTATSCPACSDGIDNDGDSLVDWMFPDEDGDGYPDIPPGWPASAQQPDPGCEGPWSSTESPECDDTVDNDLDGDVDMDDPTCFAPWWSSELWNMLAACENGVDDDGDGLTDFGEDPQCTSPYDTTEGLTECQDGIDNDGDGDVDFPDDAACGSPESELEGTQCDDGIDNDGDGAIDYPDDLGCEAPFLGIEGPPCHDGIDNDGDSLTDFPNDPGCAAPQSPSEAPACSNGIDDDGDGLIDYPADPGCTAPSGQDELMPCRDAVDNDGDALIDYPLDSGCAEPFDLSEGPDCSDGVDNDGDGLADFPQDPGCASAEDLNERADTITRACSDGIDNDGDGLVDYGDDPGCISAYDDNEYNP